MHLVIGLDIDEVLFRTSEMEKAYIKKQMLKDGYTLDADGIPCRDGKPIGGPKSFEVLKLKYKYNHMDIPDKEYVNPEFIDMSAVHAVLSCKEKHPDWEFVVITSRASLDYLDFEDLSKTRQRKYREIRASVKAMISNVLPIERFYFTECKADCMIANDIDILVDDCIGYLDEVNSHYSKVGIRRCLTADLRGPLSFYDFSELQSLIEGIEIANEYEV